MNNSYCSITTDARGRELLTHGTLQFPIACYHDDLVDNPVTWHWHEELELVFITSGAATAAADARRYSIPQGSGCFINTGVLHSMTASGEAPTMFHSLVFHPRLVGGSMDSIFWEKYVQPILLARSQPLIVLDHSDPYQSGILDLIDSVWKLCTDTPPGYEIEVRHQLTQLMMKLSFRLPAADPEGSEKTLRDGERIKIMMQFIQDHYDEDLTLAKVAESAMISESEALRCFHNTIETTPIQYLKDYRLQRAADLLTATRQKISDIADRCGFQEMSYFARAFRRKYGCTPSQYRKIKTERF